MALSLAGCALLLMAWMASADQGLLTRRTLSSRKVLLGSGVEATRPDEASLAQDAQPGKTILHWLPEYFALRGLLHSESEKKRGAKKKAVGNKAASKKFPKAANEEEAHKPPSVQNSPTTWVVRLMPPVTFIRLPRFGKTSIVDPTVQYDWVEPLPTSA